ncbi:hypothetical protein ABW20_dc0105475 [Dactylellina cionopaga]|nr:hypothetical protein ABW20_dc0105475 [Dactylellina cionopaga]
MPTSLRDDEVESDPEEWWGGESTEETLANALKNINVTRTPVQLGLTNVLKATKKLATAKEKSSSVGKLTNAVSSLVPTVDQDLSPEFSLSHVKQQYYTLLYTSKSSLQYFPKTSLARARVNFPSNGLSPSSRLDLLLCLETMVFLIDECDEKYRTGIREVAKAKKNQVGISDNMTSEQLEATIVPPKCLRENEIKYVLKWLRSLSDDDSPVRSLEQDDAHLTKSITELRSRETELQIILLLEILAIKDKLSEEKLQEYEKMKKAADRKQRRKEKANGGVLTKGKKKKKMDHLVLLDLLVDRLCIWHSIGGGNEQMAAQQENQKEAKDRLRHFCIEIVLAYYSSRLPGICEDIRWKGTGKMKQVKKQDQILSKWEKESQPTQIDSQESIQDTTEEKPNFSKSVIGRPPLLARSMTAPVGRRHFERAESSFSLSFNGDSQGVDFEFAAQVSQEKDAMKTSFRGGITNTKKAAERRVVEVANPRAKKRKVDAEDSSQLKDAIKNISKPNRLAVAEEMVSASAQRMKITGRKPKKTIRNPLANTVQVVATPRKNARTVKLLERKPEVPTSIAEEDSIPSSSQVVPQSTIKQGTKRRSPEADEVDATPSKAPRVDSTDRSRIVLHQHDQKRLNFLPSSPLCVSATPMRPKRSFTDAFTGTTVSKPNIFMSSTPTNPFKSSTDNRLGKGFMNTISETPTKPSVSSKLRSFLPTDDDEIIASSPLQRPKPGTPANRQLITRNLEDELDDGEPSIYKKLGWDLY